MIAISIFQNSPSLGGLSGASGRPVGGFRTNAEIPNSSSNATSRLCAGKFCYAVVSSDGLSAIAVADKDYPARVAISLLKELSGEMKSGENA